jgi:hypothetical protein
VLKSEGISCVVLQEKERISVATKIWGNLNFMVFCFKFLKIQNTKYSFKKLKRKNLMDDL